MSVHLKECLKESIFFFLNPTLSNLPKQNLAYTVEEEFIANYLFAVKCENLINLACSVNSKHNLIQVAYSYSIVPSVSLSVDLSVCSSEIDGENIFSQLLNTFKERWLISLEIQYLHLCENCNFSEHYIIHRMNRLSGPMSPNIFLCLSVHQ